MSTASRPTDPGDDEGDAPESVDDGWDVDDLAPPTRQVPPRHDLGLRIPSPREPTPPPEAAHPHGRGESSDMNQRATMPPPLPSDEYVDVMMSTVRESRPEVDFVPRAPMATLLEIDPLQFDRPEHTHSPMSEETPSIETGDDALDVDPELLVNTMPPPSGMVDEMDMLPFDEVLQSVNERASQPPRPPTPVGRPPAPEPTRGLRFTQGAARPPQVLRPTPPGGVDARQLSRRSDEHAQLARRMEAHDYAGALMIAESLVAANPADDQAMHCVELCRPVVIETYMRRLGDRRHPVRILVGRDVLQGLQLDHRAGFLLSCIEGSSCLDEVLDLAGMPMLDTVRLLWELVQEGVVSIGAP